ncbi:MAG: sulfatase-like hydrolase/transferase [Phycisphaeraceae bacterium]
MEDQRERPNVLLICTDHWGGWYSGAAGHPVVMTPTIDQLARTGTRFSNTYSAAPTCVPARRSLMTGQSARTHGDRIFNEHLRMPDRQQVPTMAQCFRDAGYQAHAVGKLHVYPQRDRIGFDEVILNEEGRHQFGDPADDWELFLQEQGYAGQEYASGVCNNDMMVHPWHLPDRCHPTNWAAREMCRMMHRRDPTRPAFWYLSFVGPHQPMWPTEAYLDMYRDVPIDEPTYGDWSAEFDRLPWMLQARSHVFAATRMSHHEMQIGRRAFYACITHIDHQIRVVIGYLREQGLLENTIIAFTADHGEMLGDHGLWTKAYMLEGSNKIPFIVSLPSGDDRLARHATDDRLVEIRDVMPTLLDLAGLEIPSTVDGLSVLRDQRRAHLYGEHWEGAMANRMVRDQRYKLIWYPAGNVVHLFDVEADPRETCNLADEPAHAEARQRLTRLLIDELYGDDLQWIRDGELVGEEAPSAIPETPRGLAGQRGLRFM